MDVHIVVMSGLTGGGTFIGDDSGTHAILDNDESDTTRRLALGDVAVAKGVVSPAGAVMADATGLGTIVDDI